MLPTFRVRLIPPGSLVRKVDIPADKRRFAIIVRANPTNDAGLTVSGTPPNGDMYYIVNDDTLVVTYNQIGAAVQGEWEITGGTGDPAAQVVLTELFCDCNGRS